MKIGVYVVRRLALSVPVLLGITLITFGLAWQANDGEMERAYLTEKMTPEARAKLVEQYGFDRPWYMQYFSYLERLAKLDLGVSHSQNDRLVTDVLKEFFPPTLELTLVAMILAIIGGVTLGTITAVRKDTTIDHVTRFLALSGVSIPIFWLGLLLKFALATTFPMETLLEAGLPLRAIVLAFALLGPVAIGLAAADALDPSRTAWRRLAFLALGAAGVVALFFLLAWTFVAVVGLLAGAVAFAAAAILKRAGRERLPRSTWRAAALAVGVAGFAIAASPWSGAAIVGLFDVIPDLPLGGRFSNDLIATPGEHPSLIEGPTRLLLVDTALAGDWVAFKDVARHLVLPGITLGYASLAVIARMTRSSMLEVLSLDFVRTARAKGLPESQVVRGHARRNALIPVTTVVGLTFGSLLSGAVLTETIFQWPGIGRWSTNAIIAGDTNSVMSFTLVVVVIYLVANLVVDVVYGLLDPRVRLS